jgi:hypothetical protein
MISHQSCPKGIAILNSENVMEPHYSSRSIASKQQLARQVKGVINCEEEFETYVSYRRLVVRAGGEDCGFPSGRRETRE